MVSGDQGPERAATERVAIEERLVAAREHVALAIRSRSIERLMPAIESLVQAKLMAAYVEDGGLIDRLRQMRAALEAIDSCIPPSDRALLEGQGGAAYARVALSAAAYREMRAALRSRPD